MTKISDDTFNNPELIDTLFRKAGQTDSFKKWRKALKDGPHPTPEILFDYATGDLPDAKRDEWFEHIAHCSSCTEEVYSIRSKERKLERFTEKSRTGKREWTSVTLNTQPENTSCLRTESPLTGRIFAVRASFIESEDERYWVPLLLKELQKGRARFSWSREGASKFTFPPKKSSRSKGPNYLKYISELGPGDFLIYINIAKKGECTVAQITGHHRFSRVWDPERRNGCRLFLPCTYYGGFNRNSSFVHPELSKMIGLRGSFRDLNSVKKHFTDLLNEI
ncbi:MAG: hypothetical protein ACLPVO_13075 [Desulfomonilaceae bacterium]